MKTELEIRKRIDQLKVVLEAYPDDIELKVRTSALIYELEDILKPDQKVTSRVIPWIWNNDKPSEQWYRNNRHKMCTNCQHLQMYMMIEEYAVYPNVLHFKCGKTDEVVGSVREPQIVGPFSEDEIVMRTKLCIENHWYMPHTHPMYKMGGMR